MDTKNPTAPCIHECCYATLWNINVSKKATNGKLQGVVRFLITKLRNVYCRVCELKSFFLNRRIFGKVTSKNVIVSFTLFVFYQCVGQAHKVHETITFLLVTLPNIYRLKNYLTNWAINLNLVFKNSPHLKYVATLPCNLSLRACFADINVSQGSVATYICKVR